jgi:hypothetical protein
MEQLSRKEALACIPFRNPEVEEQNKDEGILLIYYISIKPLFHSLVKKFTSTDGSKVKKKLQLDPLGTSVWKIIDGKRSVQEIAGAFQQEHQLDQREAEAAITAFLKDLGKRGLIALKDPTMGNINTTRSR